jgi:hypothetical protein
MQTVMSATQKVPIVFWSWRKSQLLHLRAGSKRSAVAELLS